MTPPSANLATVIAGAIQHHANHFRRGKPDTREVLEALGEAGCIFMMDLSDPGDRACAAGCLFRRLVESAERRPTVVATPSQ